LGIPCEQIEFVAARSALTIITSATFRIQFLSNQGGFNLGGLNASGQVCVTFRRVYLRVTQQWSTQIPNIGNYGLIDLDTPPEAYTKPGWRDPSKRMQLVFSDEFNRDGRTFYPGDDAYWEAVDLHYWVCCIDSIMHSILSF
jgi:beta-glucan synthesis-associated protein KRE6